MDLLKVVCEFVGYESFMDVKVDQNDSYYLAIPDKQKFKNDVGKMFATIQIMDITVDLFIGSLMNKKEKSIVKTY